MSDLLTYYRNNIGATMSLLRAMQVNDVWPLVFSGQHWVLSEPAQDSKR